MRHRCNRFLHADKLIFLFFQLGFKRTCTRCRLGSPWQRWSCVNRVRFAPWVVCLQNICSNCSVFTDRLWYLRGSLRLLSREMQLMQGYRLSIYRQDTWRRRMFGTNDCCARPVPFLGCRPRLKSGGLDSLGNLLKSVSEPHWNVSRCRFSRV